MQIFFVVSVIAPNTAAEEHTLVLDIVKGVLDDASASESVEKGYALEGRNVLHQCITSIGEKLDLRDLEKLIEEKAGRLLM